MNSFGAGKTASSLAIASVWCGKNASPSIAYMDLDSQQLINLVSTHSGQQPAISPDGTKAMVYHWDAATEAEESLFIVDLESGERLLRPEGTCDLSAEECLPPPDMPFAYWPFRTDWLPDGSLIAVHDIDRESGIFDTSLSGKRKPVS